MHKSSELLNKGIEFVNEIKDMLSTFGIKTTKTWTGDNGKTKHLRFNVRSDCNSKFKNEIGFNLKHKDIRWGRMTWDWLKASKKS